MAEDPTEVNGAEAAAPASFSSPSFTPPGTGSAPAAVPRPEIAIGAAFAGGFVVAMLLKRLGD